MTILKMSFMASILIVLIVMIRMLAIHKLPKKLFTILWGIVLFRLVIPFSIPVNFLSQKNSESILQRTMDSKLLESILLHSRDPLTTQSVIDQNQSFTNINNLSVSPYVWIWVIGFILLATFFVVTHIRYLREYKTSLPVKHPYIEEWISNCSLKRKLDVRESDKIISPLTYGILRPVILLPKGIDYSDRDHLQYVLTHEFVHIKRFDTLYKWILVMTLCLHWFNPFVWLFYVLANRDLELSCDEAVVNTFGESKKSDYAFTLIHLAESGSKWAPLSSSFSKQSIEERIVAVMKPSHKSIVTTILTLVFVLGVTFITYADDSETRSYTLFDQVHFSDDMNQYASYVHGYDRSYIVDQTYMIDGDYEKFVFILSPVYTGDHVYALIGLQGDHTDGLDLNGQIVGEDGKYIDHLTDTFKVLEKEGDVQYFLYHGETTDHQKSFQDFAGDYLGISVSSNGTSTDLTVPIEDVSSETLLFIPEIDQYEGVFYDAILLTTHALQMFGEDENIENSEGEVIYPHFQIKIVRNKGQDIHMSYDTRGLIADEGFHIGAASGGDGQGGFYQSFDFRNFELDLSDVSAFMINDVTYHIAK